MNHGRLTKQAEAIGSGKAVRRGVPPSADRIATARQGDGEGETSLQQQPRSSPLSLFFSERVERLATGDVLVIGETAKGDVLVIGETARGDVLVIGETCKGRCVSYWRDCKGRCVSYWRDLQGEMC